MIYMPILIGLVVFAVFVCIAEGLCNRPTTMGEPLVALVLVVGMIVTVAVVANSFEDIKDGRLDGRAPSMEARK